MAQSLRRSCANVAVIYNPKTGQWAYTGYVRSQAILGFGQHALTPALPSSDWVYAGQAHAHTNGTSFSGADFFWANTFREPIFIKTNGISVYVPPLYPRGNMSTALGQVFNKL